MVHTERMRTPGACGELTKEEDILMKNTPLDMNELHLEPAIDAVKRFYPHLWTKSNNTVLYVSLFIMTAAYVQGMMDGKKIERAKVKARKKVDNQELKVME